MNKEQKRLKDPAWKLWGPYLTNRQWGTVREDYSENGDAWNYTYHDVARSKAYRWGEEGIGGISDDQQLLCFSVTLWNEKDPILKEVFFGLNNLEGNHGEDVKELYYYLDNTPTHSYMKMLYKYPQQRFPFEQLLNENQKRTKKDGEYEITDTGVFDNNHYFDVIIEYAKAGPEDLLIQITVHNRSDQTASLHVLPTLWFRNTWYSLETVEKPSLYAAEKNIIRTLHPSLKPYSLLFEEPDELLFCENETNIDRLYGVKENSRYYKDGINNYLIHREATVNPDLSGTKAAVHYAVAIPANNAKVFRMRLSSEPNNTLEEFDTIMNLRKEEADDFYRALQHRITNDDFKNIQRQAWAGMLWSKQYYCYNVQQWLDGDPSMPSPPINRKQGRNHEWKQLDVATILAVPDKWEFPWYAAWDSCFQCVSLALIDLQFARQQLLLLMKTSFMHPTGQLPAYEWSFSDVNPPVQAWAVWEVYLAGKNRSDEKENFTFLESAFHKLLINFTWWVNRLDKQGNNIFEGGFLGLDNIGIFDRNAVLPNNVTIEQADASSWMAMFALNMMHIALELSSTNKTYIDLSNKFFEHFLLIAGAIDLIGEESKGLWDEADCFFYDQLTFSNSSSEAVRLKVRSMVGIIPLFVVEVLDKQLLQRHPEFTANMQWFLEHRPDLAALVSFWNVEGHEEKRLLSLLRGHRMKGLLRRMLDTSEFLSDHGIRSLSKYHEKNPFQFCTDGSTLEAGYVPGESDSPMFGGNSNWRGPIWVPMNYLIIKSLKRFYRYYGDDFKVEYPTHSGSYCTLLQIAQSLQERLVSIFTKNENGERVCFGSDNRLQTDDAFKDILLFHEYFHGETGKGLGASHQTGWTALIANLINDNT